MMNIFVISVLGLLINLDSVKAESENVALNKATNQSSTHMLFGTTRLESNFAVDGNTDGSVYGLSCMHTKGLGGDWWMVDLNKTYDIQQIKIWNREDCCYARLSNFEISVSNSSINDPDMNFTLCLFHADPFEGMKSFAFDKNCTGKTVRLALPSNVHLGLHVCEVEVYGLEVVPEGLSPPQVQSSSTQGIGETSPQSILLTAPPDLSSVFSSESTSSQSLVVSTPILTDIPQSATLEMTQTISQESGSISTSTLSMTLSSDLTISMSSLHILEESMSSCSCGCYVFNHSIASATAEVVQSLKLNSTSLSKYRRRKISVENKMQSATYVGSVGVVFVAFIFTSLLLSDCLSVVKFLLIPQNKRRRY